MLRPHALSRSRRRRLGQVDPYHLRDLFTTDLAAGSVDGASAEPGPGIREVTDPGSKISLAGGWLKLTSPGAWNTTYLYHTSNAGAGFARAAGLVLEFDWIPHATTKQALFGFFNSATINLTNTEHVLYVHSGNMYARNATTSTNLSLAYGQGIRYRLRLVLQAAGAKFYLSGGAFGALGQVWTLLHTDNSENSATLWPAFMSYNGSFDLDNVNIPRATPTTNTGALDGDLVTAINTWQGTADLIHTAGVKEADWAASANVSGVDASGRTYIAPGRAVEQHGYLRKIRLSVNAKSGAAWKIKAVRYNTGTSEYEPVGEEAFTPSATGAQEHTLSSPIAVQPGDIPGLFVPTATDAVNTSGTRAHKMRVATGDITASNAFGTEHGDDTQFEVDCLTNRPYLAVTGDSLMAGHNTANPWRTGEDNSAVGGAYSSPGCFPNIGSGPAHIVRTKVTGTVLQWQNHALGSTGSEWARTDGVPNALDTDPAALVLLTGANDLHSFGNDWDDIEPDLDAIATLVAASNATLYVCEILPTSSDTDEEAATIRSTNASLATWCAANSAILVECHDAMGQTRDSTGELDDLFTHYDKGDLVHLSAAGVDKLAEIIYLALIENA